MQREHRYMVFKLKDMRAALSQYEDALLKHLAGKINDYRIREGKAPLQCVVVESDWPEYEPTWHAIEGRVVAAAPSPPQDPRDEARYKAKEIMQHGRIVTLVAAMEEAAASIEAGMAQGALGTLRKTLHDDKTFFTSSPAR